MECRDLFKNVLSRFFSNASPLELWTICPNHMLWEAIKQEDAQPIELLCIPDFLKQQKVFFAFPEPLPAIYNNKLLEYVQIECSDENKDDLVTYGLFEQEPLYIVDCEFKWMVVLTTENTQTGTQLCVMVNAKQH